MRPFQSNDAAITKRYASGEVIPVHKGLYIATGKRSSGFLRQFRREGALSAHGKGCVSET